MSIRTYCVIPHSARADTHFFQGVFEDGLRVLYQGRLHSLLFSHVLSPAHDYVKHINGPLLAALHEGGNATLILATPNSEVPTASSTSASTTAAARGSGKAEDMAEVTPTVMELYAQLFPLLFRSVEGCATARVSAVTVSATERVLLDNLQGDRRLRSIGEAHQLVLHRHTSATQWGSLLRLLEERHVAIEDSATALEGQTACVVTVELSDYGCLMVVDTASSQELLQQLTLILGMEAADGEGRTYPPQTPLRDLLKHSTPAEAVVQVVCLPAPRETVRQTMRVLHFGSAIETWRSRIARGRSSNSQELSTLHTSYPAGSGTSARPKHFTRPAAAASPSVSFEMDSAGHQRAADASHAQRHAGAGLRNTADAATPLHSPESSDESGGDDDSGRGRRGSTSSIASQPQRYVPSAESSGAALRRDTVLHHGATPEHLPPSTVDRAAAVRDHEKEEQLRRQVRSLEARLADMARGEAALRRERDDAVREKERVQLALRSKESMWADLQRAHNKAKQENADYAQLVDKLLKQVRVMERDTSRQKQQDMSVVRQLRQTREEKAELEAQVTRLRKEVMLFRREATYRAREATLSRIVPSDISVPAPQSRVALLRSGAASRSSSALAGTARVDASLISSSSVAPPRHGRRPSPRARRLYDSFSSADGANEGEDAAATKNPARSILDSPAAQHSTHPSDAASAQSRRVTDITVEELRWRNRHLEEEVNRLQERLLRALASENRAAASTAANHSTPSAVGASCPSCDAMRERAEYFSAELTHVREEKDSLLDLVKSSNSSKVVSAKKVRFPKEEEEEAEEGRVSQASAAAEEEEEEEGTSSRKDKRGVSAVTRHVAGATHDVVAALLTGCASLQSQLASAQAVLDRRLHHATHTDPLSHVSSRVLLEHREAVAALSESLRCVADKPATVASPYASPSTLANQSAVIDGKTSSLQQQRVCLPPVPRCATAGNVEVLTGHLAFEAERCRHLRAFLPTFAQLAVATEHLLMRLEATEPES